MPENQTREVDTFNQHLDASRSRWSSKQHSASMICRFTGSLLEGTSDWPYLFKDFVADEAFFRGNRTTMINFSP